PAPESHPGADGWSAVGLRTLGSGRPAQRSASRSGLLREERKRGSSRVTAEKPPLEAYDAESSPVGPSKSAPGPSGPLPGPATAQADVLPHVRPRPDELATRQQRGPVSLVPRHGHVAAVTGEHDPRVGRRAPQELPAVAGVGQRPGDGGHP